LRPQATSRSIPRNVQEAELADSAVDEMRPPHFGVESRARWVFHGLDRRTITAPKSLCYETASETPTLT
jgi:hypothetical protein